MPDPDAYTKEFGYFDRNDKMNKNVFICGGGAEDPQYEKYYNGHELTLEGVKSLSERLNGRCMSVESVVYEGKYHVNYVKPMLKEYLEQNFPAGGTEN